MKRSTKLFNQSQPGYIDKQSLNTEVVLRNQSDAGQFTVEALGRKAVLLTSLLSETHIVRLYRKLSNKSHVVVCLAPFKLFSGTNSH